MVYEAGQLNQAVHSETEDVGDRIVIPSQNKSEDLTLNVEELLVIKAVENYIEVHANENGKLSKTILRNTLNNAEVSSGSIKNLIKCHRSYLV